MQQRGSEEDNNEAGVYETAATTHDDAYGSADRSSSATSLIYDVYTVERQQMTSSSDLFCLQPVRCSRVANTLSVSHGLRLSFVMHRRAPPSPQAHTHTRSSLLNHGGMPLWRLHLLKNTAIDHCIQAMVMRKCNRL